MPRPGGFRMRGDPNRDYQLLAGDDAEAQEAAKAVRPGRLLSLARDEAWVLTLASLVLLVASVGQVAFPKLAGGQRRLDAARTKCQGSQPWLLALRGLLGRILRRSPAVRSMLS
jgi:hypothetical protein